MDWIKKKIVRSNTVRNYTERYIKNIKPVIGEMQLSDVKPLHCQKIFYNMADQEYRTSTIDIQKTFLQYAEGQSLKISIVLYYKPDCEQANW